MNVGPMVLSSAVVPLLGGIAVLLTGVFAHSYQVSTLDPENSAP